mmetsp:Transcript_18790/g.59085  ORF Transcript_18790/g.59085 Transcript_18790/m.59085 type:complete len:119 (+) Transcript_18790:254-610(+)
MDVLQRNVRENVSRLASPVEVLELDWVRPMAPSRWALAPADKARAVCSAQPADVIVATEVIYEVHGARLLADLLLVWLSRPGGTLYSRRSGVAEFEAACRRSGLIPERLLIDLATDVV